MSFDEEFNIDVKTLKMGENTQGSPLTGFEAGLIAALCGIGRALKRLAAAQESLVDKPDSYE